MTARSYNFAWFPASVQTFIVRSRKAVMFECESLVHFLFLLLLQLSTKTVQISSVPVCVSIPTRCVVEKK